MAAVMTATRVNYPHGKGSRITLDWTSHTDGSVALSICDALGYSSGELIGKLIHVETSPGALGVAATNPPDSYALTLVDSYSLDILDGAGAGRSATVAERIDFVQPLQLHDDLTLTISGAGSANQGRVILTLTEV